MFWTTEFIGVEAVEVARPQVARWHDCVAGGNRFDDLFGRHSVLAEALGVGANDHRALVAPKRRRRADSGQRREHRPHAEERQILNLSDAARVTGKDKLSDRHAARVKTHDEGRHGARRHECARPLDISDGLRERLAHVRAGMEEEFDEPDILNGFRFDVLDACDVEEVILVVRDQVALHLRRVHPAIGLRDVDHRQVEIRKDVHRHSRVGENRAERDGNDSNKDREGTDECSIDQPHRLRSSFDWCLCHLLQKGFEVALHSGRSQQRAPDGEPRHRVINLCLRQQSLCIGNLGDVRQPVFVSHLRRAGASPLPL